MNCFFFLFTYPYISIVSLYSIKNYLKVIFIYNFYSKVIHSIVKYNECTYLLSFYSYLQNIEFRDCSYGVFNFVSNILITIYNTNLMFNIKYILKLNTKSW